MSRLRWWMPVLGLAFGIIIGQAVNIERLRSQVRQAQKTVAALQLLLMQRCP